MALGTPVAAATAYSGTGGAANTVTPAYPTGILTTDAVLLFVGQKPTAVGGGTVTTPTGWTLVDSLTNAGGYAAQGADSGNTNLFVYEWDAPVANQAGNLSVSMTGNDSAWAFMVRIPSGGGTLSYGSADGQRTTAPTVNVAFATALTNGATPTAFKTGDLAIWAMCIPTDVTTPGQFSAQSVTATGVTFGAAVELNEPDSGTNNDVGGYSAYASVSSGTSTTAPTVTVTAGGTVTNVRGPIVLVRVRETTAISFNAESGSYSLTGQAATTRKVSRLNAESGAYALTGQPATFAKERSLNAEVGSYSLTGQAATTRRTRNLNAEVGAYSLAGQAATLRRTRNFNAESGAYSLTGQAATVAKGRKLNAEVGTYALTGQDAELDATVPLRTLNAQAGSYTLSGQQAALSRGRRFNAESGTYSATGQPATLKIARQIAANAGALTVTGQPATLARRRNPNAQAGAYSLTGQPATFRRTSKLNAQVGSYNILGQPAGLQTAAVTDPGAYSLTGQPATLTKVRRLSANAGAYARSTWADPSYVDPNYAQGTDARLAVARKLNAQAGQILLTGQPATLDVDSVGEYVDRIYKLLANRQELDPVMGKFRVYDNDSVTVLYQANAWEDAAGTIPYSGNVLRRIDRLMPPA